MTDFTTIGAQAIARGFTERYFVSDGDYDFDVLVRDDADLDGEFNAFDLDNGDFIRIRGWMASMIHKQ